jgi:acyl-CoA thioester hydrolase
MTKTRVSPDKGQIIGATHHFPLRVYYENTDLGQIVYHAEYVKFMERARTEFLRALGIHQSDLVDLNIFFVVYHMDISFHGSAKLDDILVAKTQLSILKGASLNLEQKVFRGEELLVAAEVKICVVNNLQKPTRFPKHIFSLLQDHLLITQ